MFGVAILDHAAAMHLDLGVVFFDLLRIRDQDQVLFVAQHGVDIVDHVVGDARLGDRAVHQASDGDVQRGQLGDAQGGHHRGEESDQTEGQAEFELDREAHELAPGALRTEPWTEETVARRSGRARRRCAQDRER
jgi:hypothetical protein